MNNCSVCERSDAGHAGRHTVVVSSGDIDHGPLRVCNQCMDELDERGILEHYGERCCICGHSGSARQSLPGKRHRELCYDPDCQVRFRNIVTGGPFGLSAPTITGIITAGCVGIAIVAGALGAGIGGIFTVVFIGLGVVALGGVAWKHA